MRVAVIIPCHIHYKGQLEKLLNCINSLKEQTHPCTIIVGISFTSNEYYSIFKNKVFPLLKRDTKFIIRREQTYQIMHIYNCLQKVNDHDYILFCDDDDKYLNKRVQTFVEISNSANIIREKIPFHNEESEYWCYGMKPCVLLEFYSRSSDHLDLLCHKFGDIYLRNFLLYNQMFGLIVTFTAKSPLYIYDEQNENSITGTIKRKREFTQNTGLIDYMELSNQYLLTLINNDIEKCDLIIKHISKTDMSLNMIINRAEIEDFCKKLYV